jgi:hypothetical protein
MWEERLFVSPKQAHRGRYKCALSSITSILYRPCLFFWPLLILSLWTVAANAFGEYTPV